MTGARLSSETVHATHHSAYARQYPLFRRLYEATKDIAADLDPPT